MALATHNFDNIAEEAMAVFKKVGGFDCFYKVLDVVEDGTTCTYL